MDLFPSLRISFSRSRQSPTGKLSLAILLSLYCWRKATDFCSDHYRTVKCDIPISFSLIFVNLVYRSCNLITCFMFWSFNLSFKLLFFPCYIWTCPLLVHFRYFKGEPLCMQVILHTMCVPVSRLEFTTCYSCEMFVPT